MIGLRGRRNEEEQKIFENQVRVYMRLGFNSNVFYPAIFRFFGVNSSGFSSDVPSTTHCSTSMCYDDFYTMEFS